MLDTVTEQLPTAKDRDVWALDLAKRIIRNGRDSGNALIEQQKEALSAYEQEALPDGN